MKRRGGKIAMLAAAFAVAAGAATPPEPAMNDAAPPQVTVEQGPLRLHATFDYDAVAQTLRIRYRLDNGGGVPVMVFDRGDSLAVAQKRLPAGAVAEPRSERDDGDGLSVVHRAWPLRKPAPTVPPVPLAARVIPGASLAGEVRVDTAGAKRLRYCLGSAPFDAERFSSPQDAAGTDLWRASFDVVDRQALLCTPWFDTATRTFAPG